MPEYKTWNEEDETQLWEEFCKTPEGTRFQFTGDFGTQHGVHKGKGHLELQALTGVYNVAVGDPKNGYVSATSGLPGVISATWEIVVPWEGAMVILDRHGDTWVRHTDDLYSIPNEDGTLTGSAHFNDLSPTDLERQYGPCIVVLDSRGVYEEQVVEDDDDDNDDDYYHSCENCL